VRSADTARIVPHFLIVSQVRKICYYNSSIITMLYRKQFSVCKEAIFFCIKAAIKMSRMQLEASLLVLFKDSFRQAARQ